MGAIQSTQSAFIESLEVPHDNSFNCEDIDAIDDDFLDERRRILADVQNLKQYAAYYMHPEIPIKSGICARCYYDRPSAPQQESMEDAEERHRILEECHTMRHFAGLSLHPEYFNQTLEPTLEPETHFERHMQAQILQDAMLLKQYASFHLHPELPVTTTDPTACARCYFDRLSAPQQQGVDDSEEQKERILHDIVLLKRYARFYLHPELPVITMDPTACARCFFDRPLIPEQERIDEMEEHSHILEEAEMLKAYAKFYLHPEESVKTCDGAACERCYFDRPSAPERRSWDEAEEIHHILEDAGKLEELAQIRLHDHVFERDYFHCHFAMDEDSAHTDDENPVHDEEEDMHTKPCSAMKAEVDFHMAQSPPSIFGFA